MQSAPPRAQIPKLEDLPLVIDTPRLRLRPIERTDAEALFRWASDPEVAKMMAWAAHANVDETRAWVDSQVAGRAAQTDLTWAIEHDGDVIGVISFGVIKWQFRAWRVDRAELGYWIGKPHWGQGFVSEAATAATRWGFETLGLHKITIGCIEGNAASKKIIEKIGYRYLCKMEDDVWRDGRWWGHLRYELNASEWGDTTRTLRFKRPVLG